MNLTRAPPRVENAISCTGQSANLAFKNEIDSTYINDVDLVATSKVKICQGCQSGTQLSSQIKTIGISQIQIRRMMIRVLLALVVFVPSAVCIAEGKLNTNVPAASAQQVLLCFVIISSLSKLHVTNPCLSFCYHGAPGILSGGLPSFIQEKI